MKKHTLHMVVVLLLIMSNSIFSSITKGPYLTAPKENSMTIMWESDSSAIAKFIYWQNESDKIVKTVNFFDSNNNKFLYKVVLNCLIPNQKYYYKVLADSDSSEAYFYTAVPKGTPFTFVAIGDSRSNHDVFSAIAEDVEELSPRLVISMGDLVRKGKTFSDWKPHFFDPAKELIKHIPHISTLGDHETAGKYNGYNFYYYFRNGTSVDKMWFSYDYGDVHFISLDFRGETNKEMIEWFKNDVKQSDAKWKIVYLHRPMYNLGGHRAHWGKNIWQKLFRDAKIDIVFGGHSHIYERFYPMRPSNNNSAWPVTFITTGGAGAGLYGAIQNEYVAVSKSVNHYNVISVSYDTLKIKSILLDGTTIDKFEIVKNGGKYSDSYLELVKSQDVMDVYMAFAYQLRIKFDSIPTKDKPSRKKIKFYGDGILEDVPFELKLSKESSKYYKLESFKGVLKRDEKYKGTVVLFAKDDKVKQRHNYLDPPLFFILTYKYKGKEYTVYGSESRNTVPYKK